jgi:hypothetical protein
MINSVNGISATDLVAPGAYTITKVPDPICYCVLGSGGYPTINFAMYIKPTDEQIKNIEQLLGWRWEDA